MTAGRTADRPCPSRRGRAPALAAGVALAALMAALYHPVAGYTLTGSDAARQLQAAPLAHDLSWEALGRTLTTRSVTSYYPVRSLSLGLDAQLWGRWGGGYHLTSLALHAASVLVLYILLLNLLRSTPAGGTWRVVAGATGAALYAVHPVTVEPVAWLGGREELLAALFVLACLCAMVFARRAAADRRTAAYVAWLAGGTLAGAAACGSNVAGAVVPLLAAIILRAVPERPGWGRLALETAPLWLFAAVAILLKLATPGALPELAAGSVPAARRPGLILAVYWHNLVALLAPHGQALHYPQAVPTEAMTPASWAGLAATTATSLLVAALWRWRRRLVLVGVVMAVAAALPAAQLLPHHILRADRLLYLPLVGLALAVAALLAGPRKPRWRGAGLALALGVVAVAAVRSAAYLPHWRDDLAIYTRGVTVAPKSPTARNNYGVALERAGRLDQARDQYRRALEIDPEYVPALVNLGDLLAAEGAYDTAAELYEEAVALAPEDATAHYNLAVVQAERGYYDDAIALYRRAGVLDPTNPLPWYNQGVMLAREGHVEEAVFAFEQALKADPRDARSHYNLGVLLAREGRIREAIARYRAALDADPNHLEAHANLAVLLEAGGDTEGAARHLLAAINLARARGQAQTAARLARRLEALRNRP